MQLTEDQQRLQDMLQADGFDAMIVESVWGNAFASTITLNQLYPTCNQLMKALIDRGYITCDDSRGLGPTFGIWVRFPLERPMNDDIHNTDETVTLTLHWGSHDSQPVLGVILTKADETIRFYLTLEETNHVGEIIKNGPESYEGLRIQHRVVKTFHDATQEHADD